MSELKDALVRSGGKIITPKETASPDRLNLEAEVKEAMALALTLSDDLIRMGQ